MFLRVYALYGRDKRVLTVGLTVFAVMIAVCIVSMSRVSSALET